MFHSSKSPVKSPCSSCKPLWHQRWLWGHDEPTLGKDLRTIALIFGLPALLIWLCGGDTPIARMVYQTDPTHLAHSVATFLRRNGTLPGAFLALVGLLTLLWPHLHRTRPLLYRTALVVTLTAILGVGFANQIVVKKLADRTRPLESVLLDSPVSDDGFRGNSMPSGHAAMGFVLAAPFFPLRRQRPLLAKAFLAAGLVGGTIVGLSRMMLGAHFATDILIAGLITLAAASVFEVASRRLPRIPPLAIAGLILISALAVILGNRFTNQTFTYTLTGPVNSFNLPCTPVSSPVAGTTTPTLTVSLQGYGAPLSTLKLTKKQGVISIQRHLGLYHHLSCSATIALPTM